MTSDLPAPLPTPECDLRALPPPREMLIACAMASWGMSRRQAEREVDAFLASMRTH